MLVTGNSAQALKCEPRLYKPIVSLSFSSALINPGDPQTLYLIPSTPEHYTSENYRQESWGVSLFLGLERDLTQKISYQIGLIEQINSSVGIRGNVWDFGSPEYNNFIYTYRVQFSELMAGGKLLGNFQYGIHPYIEAELGVAVNNAHSFTLIPLEENVPKGNIFTNRVNTSFTYGGGFGIDKDLYDNFRMGLGLNFANWGKTALGKSGSQATNQTLKINNLYNQQIRLKLTYII